jgi:hypothetical protein
MLHVSHLDVAYVAMVYTYVAKYISQMFQLFHLDVAYVAMAIRVVASVCSKYFT